MLERNRDVVAVRQASTGRGIDLNREVLVRGNEGSVGVAQLYGLDARQISNWRNGADVEATQIVFPT